jgi:regulator of sirC expression with transglutaminase-like and TPR domain
VGLLQTGAALSDADQAIKLAPDNASAHELRAYINRQLGRTEQAIADLRAALRADPSREALKEALLKLGVAP